MTTFGLVTIKVMLPLNWQCSVLLISPFFGIIIDRLHFSGYFGHYCTIN